MTKKDMKQRYRGLAGRLALSALALLGACAEHDEAPQDTAGLLTVTLSDASATSRSLPADLMLTVDGRLVDEVAGQFALTVTSADGSLRRECRTTEGALHLPLGTYTIEAAFGQDDLLAWDVPRYVGSAQVTLSRKGEQQAVDVPCTLQNALATFDLKEVTLLESVADDYYVRVIATDAEGSDTLCWRPTQTVHPYFRAGAQLRFDLIAQRTATQQTFTLPFGTDIESARPCTRYHFALQIGVATGSTSGLSLSVDRQELPVTLSETLPETALPAPRIAAVSTDDSQFRFDDLGQMEYVETYVGDAVFQLNTARAATEARMTLSGVGSLADGTYDLLLLPESTLEAWAEQGLEVTTSADLRRRTLDFSQVISALESQADGSDTNSEIAFTLTANGLSTTQTYRIHTVAPLFSTFMDDRLGWSKTIQLRPALTVTRGNAERLFSLLTFEYKAADESEWTSVTPGTEEVHWETSPAQKDYEVRAFYRGREVLAASTVKLEEEAQIPNSGFEEWTDDKYDSNSRYSFNPWWESNKGSCHWDTNNAWTTRHRINGKVFGYSTIASYNGFHAVSYVAGHDGSNLAAELHSTANGRGNTSGSAPKTQNKVAGLLFTGSYYLSAKTGTTADSNGNDTGYPVKDAVFSNRPSGLSFWYKFTPCTNNEHPTDSWQATLQLLDANKNVIAEQALSDWQEKTDWTHATVQIDYATAQVYEKCAYIYVEFRSTVNEGQSMPYTTYDNYPYYTDSTIDEAHRKTRGTVYAGSQIILDDVTLIYDK
jgi:hypothetical protein